MSSKYINVLIVCFKRADILFRNLYLRIIIVIFPIFIYTYTDSVCKFAQNIYYLYRFAYKLSAPLIAKSVR